MGMQYTELDVQ